MSEGCGSGSSGCCGTLADMDDLGQLRRKLSDLCEQHLGELPAARVMSLSRPGIRLIRGPAGACADKGSRLGGDPVMAPGMQWPAWDGVPLSFLAVIDLAKIAPLDDSGLLPPTGFLNFFYRRGRAGSLGVRPGAVRRMAGPLRKARRRAAAGGPAGDRSVPGARATRGADDHLARVGGGGTGGLVAGRPGPAVRPGRRVARARRATGRVARW